MKSKQTGEILVGYFLVRRPDFFFVDAPLGVYPPRVFQELLKMGKLPVIPSPKPTQQTQPTLGGPGKDGQEVDHVEGIRGKPRLKGERFIWTYEKLLKQQVTMFSENHINICVYMI